MSGMGVCYSSSGLLIGLKLRFPPLLISKTDACVGTSLYGSEAKQKVYDDGVFNKNIL